MRPVKVTVTGVGTSSIIPMDYDQAPFAVGLGTVLVSGTATWSVQHTFDNVQDSTVTPTWFTNSGINAVTASTDGNYAFPVRAIRLNVTLGTGTVSLTAIQGRRGS